MQFFEGTVVDITERKQYEDKLLHQATHDSLTGLPNRAVLHDRIEQAIAKARREGNQMAVVFVDLDHFKLINDSLGHLTGDQLLIATAERLESSLRAVDIVARLGSGYTVARLGGDEFTVLLDNIRTTGDVTGVAERISTDFSLHQRAGMERIGDQTVASIPPVELVREQHVAELCLTVGDHGLITLPRHRKPIEGERPRVPMGLR